ncbi:MAG: filamentous hemagglutinin N-terminal domain-containing protein [Limnothrix sp. RL_2_0]|nr:filamentous hemagglutinin N-terminal domain-containing protein [Limnothrix sp. RL_2_0]
MASSTDYHHSSLSFCQFHSLIFGVTITSLGLANVAIAQPITTANDGTATNIISNGNTYLITGGSQSGRNLFHSFEQFGLGSSDIANFVGTPDLNNILGRVTGGNVSIIEGLLKVSNSNANLYLLNPMGLVFGADAQLDIQGSFTATTATSIGFENGQFNATGLNDYSSLVGHPNVFNFGAIAATTADGIPGGSIINLGELFVNLGQNLSFIGRSLLNAGTLSAPAGQIAMVSVPGETAQTVRYTQPGMILGLELLTLDEQPNPIDLPNIALIDLPQYLTGSSTAQSTKTTNPFDPSTASHSLESGHTIISGQINTASPSSNGGDILITGNRIKLIEASIDASGKYGGGNIRIGGDYQGQGILPTATNTFVNNGTAIAANAWESGNGGEIIVWADQSTYFHGTATAKGGLDNGNGGLVETSGKIFLDVAGSTVQTTAPQGETGLWLLDPSNITIQTGGSDNNISGSPNFIPGAGVASVLTEAILEAAEEVLGDRLTRLICRKTSPQH